MAKTAGKPRPTIGATANNWKRQRRQQKQRTAICCRIAVIVLAAAYIIVLFQLIQQRGSVIEVEGYQIRFGGGALSFFKEDKNQPITDTDTEERTPLSETRMANETPDDEHRPTNIATSESPNRMESRRLLRQHTRAVQPQTTRMALSPHSHSYKFPT
jgi:hypothetical protein